MNNKLASLFFSLFFLFSLLEGRPLQLSVKAPHACLINLETGQILYEKRAKERVFPASVTKIATILYAIEMGKWSLDQEVVCRSDDLIRTTEEKKKASNYQLPAYYLEMDGVFLNLKPGERITMEALLHGILLSSGNDASNVLARVLGGTIENFMEGLNEYLQTLGCQDTHFMNPHGLHHPDHYTSAYDMGIIVREAMKRKFYRSIVKKTAYKQIVDERVVRKIKQTNQLLRRKSTYYYPFAFGGKTGYTKLAGYNLVAVAKNYDRKLAAVVLKAPTTQDRFRDAIALFDGAFAEVKESRRLFAKEDTLFTKEIPEANRPVTAVADQHIVYEYYPSEEAALEGKIHWRELLLPIKQGQPVADLVVYSELGHKVLERPLIALETVDRTLLHKVMHGLKNWKALLSWQTGCFLVTLLGLGGFIRLRRRMQAKA